MNINDFFNKVDYYLALGLSFTYGYATGTWADYLRANNLTDTSVYAGGLGITGYSGATYHFDDTWAAFVEFSSFAYTGGTVLGLAYTF